MKKTISLLSLTIILILSSCTNKDSLTSPNSLNLKKTSKIISNQIKSWSKSKNRTNERVSNDLNSLLNSEYFDFDNSISYIENDNQEIIIVNPKNIEDNVNYTITFSSESNTMYKNLLIKSSKLDNKLLVEYLNFEGKLLFTTIVDYDNKSFSSQLPNIKSNSQNISYKYPCGNTVGENTMLCIEDAYSNHGWVSVWASVQTAFIPQTAAAIAGACAVDAIRSHNSGCEGPYTPINK